MNDLTLSLVQMRSVPGEPDTNLARIIRHVSNVASHTDIICFPEACLTGYTSDRPERFAIPVSDARIEKIRETAADNDITVVFGFIEKDGSDLHINHAVSDGSGRMHLYRKTHLGRDERAVFMPGSEIRPFGTSCAKIGVQLCWESHFPEMTCKLRKCGAEIVLMPHASPLSGARRKDVWMRHIPARASDNGVFVGVVNAVGENGGGAATGGGSMVLDPKGKVIGEYFGTDENVLTVDLSAKDKDALDSDDNHGQIDYFLYRREELY